MKRITDKQIEKEQLLTPDEVNQIEAQATQFATDTPAENLEESKVIFEEEHGRLIYLLVGQKIADAQLTQDKEDQKEERRALGEWIERTLIFLSSSNSPTGQKAVEALKQGTLPEGVVK